MCRMPHHSLFLEVFFLEVGCAASVGGAVCSGMVKEKWECKIKNMRKLKLRRDQKEGTIGGHQMWRTQLRKMRGY